MQGTATTTLFEEPHRPGKVYPAGARYSEATYYDVATDRFVHGFQVFTQHAPDGSPTGRQTFLDNHGKLCSLALAEAKRKEAIEAAADDLLDGLKDLVDIIEAAGLHNLTRGVVLGPTVWYVKASDRLAHAKMLIQRAAGQPST